jgi:hypothetical protein
MATAPGFVRLPGHMEWRILHSDGVAWLSEARQTLDFNLESLAHRARAGKLKGVRLDAGTLIVTSNASDVPAAAEGQKHSRFVA